MNGAHVATNEDFYDGSCPVIYVGPPTPCGTVNYGMRGIAWETVELGMDVCFMFQPEADFHAAPVKISNVSHFYVPESGAEQEPEQPDNHFKCPSCRNTSFVVGCNGTLACTCGWKGRLPTASRAQPLSEYGKKSALQEIRGKTVQGTSIDHLTDHLEIAFTDGTELYISPTNQGLHIRTHETS